MRLRWPRLSSGENTPECLWNPVEITLFQWSLIRVLFGGRGRLVNAGPASVSLFLIVTANRSAPCKPIAIDYLSKEHDLIATVSIANLFAGASFSPDFGLRFSCCCLFS